MLKVVQDSPPSDAASTDRTAVSAKTSGGQIDSLHGLRFLAAFAILFMHACAWVPHFREQTIIPTIGGTLGVVGMPLFFVLSGFVIYYNYRSMFTDYRTPWALTQFGGARFARLFPLYLFFQLIGYTLNGQWGWFWTDWWESNVFFSAHAATLTHSWFYVILNARQMNENGFGISWSISTEWFFYLMFPAICMLIVMLKSKLAAIIALLVFAVVAQIAFIEAYLWREYFEFYAAKLLPVTMSDPSNSVQRFVFYYSPWARVFEFVLGCLVAHVFMQLKNPPGRGEKILGAMLLLVGLAGCVWAGVLQWIPKDTQLLQLMHHMTHRTFGLALALALVIFCVARYRSPVSSFLASRPLVFLGELSFSIYCVHYFVLRPFVIGQPQVPLNDANLTITIWGIALGIAATLIFSYGTYKMIEVPSRNVLRKATNSISTRLFGTKEENRRTEGARLTSPRWILVGLSAAFIALCAIYQFWVIPHFVPYITHLKT